MTALAARLLSFFSSDTNLPALNVAPPYLIT